MTESLDPLIDEADVKLVLIKPVTAEDCDRVAAEATGEGAESFRTKQLAAHLMRRWVIDLPPGWYPKHLDLESDVEIPQPDMLHRSDGPGMLYSGKIHWIYGEPESGKTWIALQAMAEELARGRQVLFIDFEMDEQHVIARLKTMGVTKSPLYLSPPGPMTEEQWSQFVPFVVSLEVTIAVFDGVTEAMSLHGWDPNSNQDAASWGNRLRMLAKAGPAVVAIDHVPKSRETRGRGPIGAQHKLAGADVALEVKVLRQPDPVHAGLLQVFVRKDRMGALRATANSADLLTLVEIIPDAGTVLIVFGEPPEGHSTSVADGGFKPTHYMERVSEWMEVHDDGIGKPPSRNAIEKGVGGKQVHIRTAIDVLAKDGYLDEIADGNARRYRFVKPYRQDGDE